LDAPAVDPLLLLPMIDGLLIAAYRLRRPTRRTAGAVGFLVGGGLATAAIFAGFWVPMDVMLLPLSHVANSILEATNNGLTRWLGDATMQSWPMELALSIGFVVLLAIAHFCLPALAMAWGGAWLAGRLGRGKPASKPLVARQRPA
jgi:hypothetical protein